MNRDSKLGITITGIVTFVAVAFAYAKSTGAI